MKNAEGRAPINGVVVFGAHALTVAQLPAVPADRKEVLDAVEGMTWRIPEANRAEAVNGLREIEARASKHGAELGDLAPAPDACRAVADELDELYKVEERLGSLQEYVSARRAACEQKADRFLRDAYEEATRRIARGRIPAESYGVVRAYSEAHSVAVSQGLARAAKVRAEVKPSAPANETHAPAKTGTGEP
jgi:hypothetical protein